MKIISFFNQKGGVGKTTSVVNLAATFSKNLRKKVLVVDCDSQQTASKYLLTYCEETSNNIKNYYSTGYAKDCIVKIYSKENVNKDERFLTHIALIPSCYDIETIQLNSIDDVKSLLEQIEPDFDYCFMDLPPHLSGISLSALVASDYVIVPAHADTDSLAGYEYLIDTIGNIRQNEWNINLKILGVIFNDVASQRIVQKYILERTKEDMKDLIFPTLIKSSSVIEQARFFGVPLPFTSLNKKLNADYISLAKDIEKQIRRMEQK